MITTTIQNECDYITASSSYFNTGNISVALVVTTNCKEQYSITVAANNVAAITINPAVLGLDLDALSDGVYNISFEIVQSGGTTVTESVCLLVNCTLNCLMLDTYKLAATGDEDAIIRSISFDALLASVNCTSCSCSDLCTLYSAALLENCSLPLTCSTCNAGCGCS